MSTAVKQARRSSVLTDVVMRQAEKAREEKKTEAATADQKFPNIKENAFFKLVFAEGKPEEKRSAIAQARTFSGTKEEMRQREKAYEEFKEYLSYQRELMAKPDHRAAGQRDLRPAADGVRRLHRRPARLRQEDRAADPGCSPRCFKPAHQRRLVRRHRPDRTRARARAGHPGQDRCQCGASQGHRIAAQAAPTTISPSCAPRRGLFGFGDIKAGGQGPDRTPL